MFNLFLSSLLLSAATIGTKVETSCSSCDTLARTLSAPLDVKRPFCVTGLVLHVNHSVTFSEITLKDDSGSCLVRVKDKPTVLVGQIILAKGHIKGIRSFGPHAIADTLVRLGHGTPPPPTQVNGKELMSCKYDWQHVRLRGIVQNVFASEINRNWILLTLNCGDTCVHASTPKTKNLFKKLTTLTGSLVDLTGISLPHDGTIRSKIGRIIHFAGIRDINVISSPPADPFDAPDIKNIANRSAATIATLNRHSAAGRVLAAWNDDTALLRTKKGLIVKVQFDRSPKLHAGDFVKVVGLPESDLQNINLISATAKPIPPFDSPEKPVIDLPSVLPSPETWMNNIAHWHGQTVRLRGILRIKPATESPTKVFYLDTGGRLISVNMSAVPDILDSVSTESTLEVTGTCVMDIENWRPRQTFPRINGFFVVLRSAEDVKILTRAPWWTPAKLIALIAILLAALVAIFIWNAALRRVAARKGRELMREQLGHVKANLRTSERTRLAVELHDTLAQNLTGVSMELEAAADLRGEAPPDMMAHLSIATKALKSCRDELRNCLWDLRSQALEEKDMSTAILRTLQPCVADSRLAVRFEVPRSRLSDNTTHALLRVIRELVTNAIRHGAATSVKIAGAIDGDKLLCSVTDNGGGFDPDTAPGVLQGHFGLQGIQERIAELGGTFEISSAPGKGTKATISLPIPHEC